MARRLKALEFVESPYGIDARDGIRTVARCANSRRLAGWLAGAVAQGARDGAQA